MFTETISVLKNKNMVNFWSKGNITVTQRETHNSDQLLGGVFLKFPNQTLP